MKDLFLWGNQSRKLQIKRSGTNMNMEEKDSTVIVEEIDLRISLFIKSNIMLESVANENFG